MTREEWLKSLKPGDEVCDCRFHHQRIKEIDYENDYAVLEDGFGCSPRACLDPIDHEWPHTEHKGISINLPKKDDD